MGRRPQHTKRNTGRIAQKSQNKCVQTAVGQLIRRLAKKARLYHGPPLQSFLLDQKFKRFIDEQLPRVLCPGGMFVAIYDTEISELQEMYDILKLHAKMPSSWLVMSGKLFVQQTGAQKKCVFIGHPITRPKGKTHSRNWTCVLFPKRAGSALSATHQQMISAYFANTHNVEMTFVQGAVFPFADLGSRD